MRALSKNRSAHSIREERARERGKGQGSQMTVVYQEAWLPGEQKRERGEARGEKGRLSRCSDTKEDIVKGPVLVLVIRTVLYCFFPCLSINVAFKINSFFLK